MADPQAVADAWTSGIANPVSQWIEMDFGAERESTRWRWCWCRSCFATGSVIRRRSKFSARTMGRLGPGLCAPRRSIGEMGSRSASQLARHDFGSRRCRVGPASNGSPLQRPGLTSCNSNTVIFFLAAVCGLFRLDRHMQLTPHFTLKEFTRSDTARARQVDNTPSPAAAAILRRLAQTLEQGDRWVRGNTPSGCFWCVLCGVLVIAEWRVILFLNLYLFRVIECN
ncbi:hypothetical protein [Burkholderia sp. Ac-20344]|uniref:hypothetical protein n=1 Tax=Burkholderia sp. Ac-20344 TaxID=2703890 RepID=UPI001F11F714|nr:hypothetical protein [Burkholderia sp. Ac-20344]